MKKLRILFFNFLLFGIGICSFFICFVVPVTAEEGKQPTKSPEIKNHTQEKIFYDDTKRGWYWYEQAIKEKPEKPQTVETKEKEEKRVLPNLKDYTVEQLWNMHPDDFSKLLDMFYKKAVMKPSEETMYEYMVMQDIARRKAVAVANVQMAMVQKYPEFSVGSGYPITAPGINAQTRLTQKEIKSKLHNSRNDYGLIYFYSETCEYCKEQKKILKFFIDEYKWEIKEIEINKERHIASKFNVEMVPYTILVYRKSLDFFPVSAGVISLAEIEEKVYRGIRLLSGETTMEDYSIYDFQKGGVFDTKKLPEVKKNLTPAGKSPSIR
ncbi:MAG: conjugal transfer protein TraF [Elusimicrobiales bacterium]|nr:conjugal transfer protein TraF [Elusimicrobiales bacterium]